MDNNLILFLCIFIYNHLQRLRISNLKTIQQRRIKFKETINLEHIR